MGQPTATIGNGGLVDIIGPAAPPPGHWGAAALATVAVLVLAAAGLWLYRRRRSPRRRALRRLGRLQQHLQRRVIAPRAAAFELARILGDGFGGTPLATAMPACLDQPAAWSRFAEQLGRARFGRGEPPADALLPLLVEARRWLEAGAA